MAATPAHQPDEKLVRALGVPTLTASIVNATIGAGIFVLPAIVAAAGEVCEWKLPYRTFKALQGQCLACNSGPHLTDLGLTDGDTRQIFGAVVRAA